MRVQLRRAKGWRMPENTVKVSRPSKWGNPFVVGKNGVVDGADAVRRYRAIAVQFPVSGLAELRGSNLACWCRPDQPCHADVLLELANS